MLRRAISRHATGRAARWIPALKFLAAAEIAILARRHLVLLNAAERRRLAQLMVKRDRTAAEQRELTALARRLEPRAFAGNAVDAFSPIPLPRRLREGKRRK